MRILLAEDEITASRKLMSLLKRIDNSFEILPPLESVKEVVNWIDNNSSPDLAFFDIQLADDTSFRIFNHTQVDFPVVFVTAYDDFLLEAFHHNSIHYLLKPVNEEKLRQVFVKFDQLRRHFMGSGIMQFLRDNERNPSKPQRIIARKGVDFCPVEVADIAYIFTQHKISFLKNKKNETYIADQTLSELESQLNPSQFFRVNRQYIVNIEAVAKFRSIENSKIRIEVIPEAREEIVVGKERASEFRNWVKGR